MKRERGKNYLTKKDYEKYYWQDLEYYGVFKKGKGDNLKVRVDPKRYKATMLTNPLSDDIFKIMSNRHTHYFYPSKPTYYSYKCNVARDKMHEIKSYWERHYHKLIKDAVKKIKKPINLYPGNCELFNCGIIDAGEAQIWTRYNNYKNAKNYRCEKYFLINSLFAQFIMYFAARVEAITIDILDMGEYFDRNKLFAITFDNGLNVKSFKSYKYHEKLYALWNFIKHNSETTFDVVKERFPELLYDPKEKFEKGSLATEYLKLSYKLIYELFSGLYKFFDELCEVKFHEDVKNSMWNYGQYFVDNVYDEIELMENPLGIPAYL